MPKASTAAGGPGSHSDHHLAHVPHAHKATAPYLPHGHKDAYGKDPKDKGKENKYTGPAGDYSTGEFSTPSSDCSNYSACVVASACFMWMWEDLAGERPSLFLAVVKTIPRHARSHSIPISRVSRPLLCLVLICSTWML